MSKPKAQAAPKIKAKVSKAVTRVCFLLDETSSMSGRKAETIQGFNNYVESLKKDEGDLVYFTLTTFNTGGINTRYKNTPIKDVQHLTNETYNPANFTPLYDAIGITFKAIQDSVSKEDLVVFAILTDGEENSSREYTLPIIKDLIAQHTKAGNWNITFLGVGIDAFAAGGAMGINMANTYNVGATGQSAMAMYSSLSDGMRSMRHTHTSYGSSIAAKGSVIRDKDRDKIK